MPPALRHSPSKRKGQSLRRRALDNERKESDLSSEGRARQASRPATSSEYPRDPPYSSLGDRGVVQGLTLLSLSVVGWFSGLIRNSSLGGLGVVTPKGRVGVILWVWGAPRPTNLAAAVTGQTSAAGDSKPGGCRADSSLPFLSLYLLSACDWLC